MTDPADHRADQPTDHRALHDALSALARNLRWCWHPPTADLLRDALAAAGALPRRHPHAALIELAEHRSEQLAADARLVQRATELAAELRSLPRPGPGEPVVAYLSPEFGLTEALPQYSGGLGVLAGDHLKAASDLALPLVGVGLFYREGFFHQRLASGRQVEWYETQDPVALGCEDTGVVVEVPHGLDVARARVWRLGVGAVTVLLLDTDVEENPPAGRRITDRLYSGDQVHRLHQEVVLGIGGARALAALGIPVRRYHLNEGHAGLMVLELVATEVAAGARSLSEALARIRPQVLFTTHTPVPAGIDRFPRSLIRQELGPWAAAHGIDLEQLLAAGVLPADGPTRPFNMAAFCLRAAGDANAVSALHGAVSRDMFAALPAGPRISSVTNGVHARTWVDRELAELLDRELGPRWADGDPLAWASVERLDDQSLRRLRRRARERLADLLSSRGVSGELDPDALTIGFARRFAAYKRAALVLAHRRRLVALLADAKRPVQFVFAGKAHPADLAGKAVLAEVVGFAASAASRGRFLFVPDYDMEVARYMYAGCDLWLNTPVRPMEACGTSGEKAALNGVLNCSVRDGWWDEMSDGRNGWDIPTSAAGDPHQRDLEESAALHDLLAAEIVPLYYDRSTPGHGPGPRWWERVRHAWRTLGPEVVAARMVRDYDRRYYRPAARAAGHRMATASGAASAPEAGDR